MTTTSPRSTLLIVSVLAALAFSSCTKASTEASTKAASADPASTPSHSDPMRITPGPALLESLKVGKPPVSDIGASLTVAGRVEVDETRVTRVGSPVMGRIKSLAVHEGQEVRRGQLLAQLNSTGLSDGQLQLLKSLSQRQVAQRAVERAKILLESGVIGAAELQRREAELVQATAELAAARDQLELLGMPEEAIQELEKTRALNSVSRIVASMDGTVLDRKITLGQVVQPADTIFEIADLSSVWLIADVPEQSAGHIAVGHQVEAEIGAFPGRKIHGRLSFVSATVNPDTRTVRVRVDLPNPQRLYKPAMLATIVLRDQTEHRPVVPASAIVREGDIEHVFLQLDPKTFVLKPVKLGPESAGRRVLLDGLKPDDSIVLDGAFHLNNERRRLALRGGDGA